MKPSTEGETRQPEISKDGNVIASFLPRVYGHYKGYTFILIEEAGVGYSADNEVLISSVNGSKCFGKDCQLKPVWRNPILCDRQSRTNDRLPTHRCFSS